METKSICADDPAPQQGGHAADRGLPSGIEPGAARSPGIARFFAPAATALNAQTASRVSNFIGPFAGEMTVMDFAPIGGAFTWMGANVFLKRDKAVRLGLFSFILSPAPGPGAGTAGPPGASE